jgi:hypothetical protein
MTEVVLEKVRQNVGYRERVSSVSGIIRWASRFLSLCASPKIYCKANAIQVFDICDYTWGRRSGSTLSLNCSSSFSLSVADAGNATGKSWFRLLHQARAGRPVV